jgi:hypothetical protein
LDEITHVTFEFTRAARSVIEFFAGRYVPGPGEIRGARAR